jgi:AcrR family transcriptional regulator
LSTASHRFPTAIAPRRPRADAVRNRERVLDAARAVFADGGRRVQIEDIARRAGVGVGTVYRHFPTKEALVEAVAERRWEEIGAFVADRCLVHPDPWEGFALMLRHSGEVQERDRGFCDVVEEVAGTVDTKRGPAFDEVDRQLQQILSRGREAGVLRADLTIERMRGVFCGLAAVVRSGQDWRPYVEIVLDGLRAR